MVDVIRNPFPFGLDPVYSRQKSDSGRGISEPRADPAW